MDSLRHRGRRTAIVLGALVGAVVASLTIAWEIWDRSALPTEAKTRPHREIPARNHPQPPVEPQAQPANSAAARPERPSPDAPAGPDASRDWGADPTPQSASADEEAKESFLANTPDSLRQYVVRLRARYLLPTRSARIRFAAPVQHVYLQFADIPGDDEKALLAQLGVKLEQYVTDFTWVASVARSSFDALMALPWVHGAAEIQAADKMSETLAQGTPASWAMTPEGQVQLTVRFYSGISYADASASLAERVSRIVSPDFLFDNRLAVEAAPDHVSAVAETDAVGSVAEIAPPCRTCNLDSAALSNVDDLWISPYALSGASVRVGIWDGGPVDATHPDFQGRVTVVEPGTPISHATHVAGTIGGAGLGLAQAHGMAIGSLLYSWDYYGDIVSEQSSGRSVQGILLSSNSWGYVTDASYFGKYSVYAAEFDSLIAASGLLVVKAAGNDGSGFDTIDTASSAKDILTIGAVDDGGLIASFSSRGPTDDGRIKPDVVANGVGLVSTVPGGGYASYSGTSMATPSTSGCASLVIEQYRALNGGLDPSANLVRALLCHTAREAGNAGPDYIYGYGIVDAKAAVDLLRDDALPTIQRVYTGSVSHAGVATFSISVPSGAVEFRATLAWIDPAGSTSAANAIVNNLDLSAVTPGGATVYPYRLDKVNPSALATTSGPNPVDLVEQVRVAAPGSGTWTVRVTGTSVPSGPQSFVLLIDGGGSSADVTAPAAVTNLTATAVPTSGGGPLPLSAYSVSSVSGYNAAVNAVDRNAATAWVSVETTRARTEWIIVDAGATKSVNKIRLQAPATGVSPFPRNFSLQIWSASGHWVNVAQANLSAAPAPGAWLSYPIPAVGTRYVRLYVKKTSAAASFPYNYSCAVAEIEVDEAAPPGMVTVGWTAPGDDGSVGTATSYDLRVSTAPITAANFSAATPVSGMPAPAPAGTSQSVLVSGLSQGVTYYFVLVAVDEVGNRSGLSNQATTIAP